MSERCRCSMFCRNPPMIVIDFKAPRGSTQGITGWKTKRICVIKARQILADMIANNEEAEKEKSLGGKAD